MRSATTCELLEVLRDRPNELRTRLNDPTAELSMLADPCNCRLLARMLTDHIMTMVIFDFDIEGEMVMVPIELTGPDGPLHCQCASQKAFDQPLGRNSSGS